VVKNKRLILLILPAILSIDMGIFFDKTAVARLSEKRPGN